MSTNYGPGVTECLYAMPAKGAALVAASSTVMSQAAAGTAAGGGAYGLPLQFFAMPPTGGPGRGLLLKGGGYWSVGTTADTLTMTFNLDTTAGTAAAVGLLGSTGAITPVASTSGLFEFELMVTCTIYGTTATIQTIGRLFIGAVATINGQIATLGTFGTTSANAIMIGGVNAGNSNAMGLAGSTPVYPEVFGAWSATTGAPSATLTNYYVFGIN